MKPREARTNPRAQGTNPRARAAARIELLELAIEQALDATSRPVLWDDIIDVRKALRAALDASRE